jgi:hypothetical protein
VTRAVRRADRLCCMQCGALLRLPAGELAFIGGAVRTIHRACRGAAMRAFGPQQTPTRPQPTGTPRRQRT